MRNLLITIFVLSGMAMACKQEPVKVVRESWPDGQPRIVIYYADPGQEQPIREEQFYEDGTPRLEGNYENGQRTGRWIYWYPNGNKWSEANYKAGVDHGTKTVWHESGQKYYEGEMTEGKRSGIWRFWDEQGNLTKEIDYDKP
ncbi:MAG: hypothetical protein JW861_09450 [Bacteroidales bacterium]|nr:hypothetical protein [Bacteroidales bacterium]